MNIILAALIGGIGGPIAISLVFRLIDWMATPFKNEQGFIDCSSNHMAQKKAKEQSNA